MHPLIYRATSMFASLCLLISTGCSVEFSARPSPAKTSTLTPEPLQLIDGMINACLLITTDEIESVLGTQVTSDVRYPVGMISCRYISTIDEEVILQVNVVTDKTIKQDEVSVSMGIDSAAKDYELIKTGNLDFAQKIPGLKIEDMNNFGDQAYMSTGTFNSLYILKNDIYYEFTTLVNDGMGSDGLMKLVQIALQRMP